MKFSTGVFLAFSLLAAHVAALPGLEVRQNAKQKGGNNGGRNGGNKGGKNGGNNGGNNNDGGENNNDDIQESKTLDPSVIATGFASDGQEVPAAGQVASLTSTNNFINFCAGLEITNGKQIKTGSCNPAPMGNIPSTDNMPSAKFVSPKNLDNIQENTAFTIQMAIQGMETGFFTNANENYFSAPQQLNDQGQITGHSHVVIEEIDSIDSTKPSNPTVFAFFKGLNDKAKNGVLTATVDKGLPVGTYKMSSINSAANHQPCLVPVAQHGSLDDAVYFTVGDAAQQAASEVAGGNNKADANDNNGDSGGENANANDKAAANNNNGKNQGNDNANGDNGDGNAENQDNGNADNQDNGNAENQDNGNADNQDNGGAKNQDNDNAENQDNGDAENQDNGDAENQDNGGADNQANKAAKGNANDNAAGDDANADDNGNGEASGEKGQGGQDNNGNGGKQGGKRAGGKRQSRALYRLRREA